MAYRWLGGAFALVLTFLSAQHSTADAARDAEIARMEALLTISCDPTRALLDELVAAGRAYRGAISKVERDYAREKDRQVSFLGDFALPTTVPDGLSFRFFTAFSRLRAEANDAGVLGPNDIPDGVGLGPLATAHLNPKPPVSDADKLVRAAAAKLFFDAKDEASAARLRKTRDEFQTRFEELKAEYEARRGEYLDLFGPDKIDALNDAFQSAIANGVDPARDVYRKLRDRVEELALSRRVEHCLGPIEGDAQRTAVGGAVDPFFVQGPDNTVGGIPGMGFVLTAAPRIEAFKPEPVPDFGYKFNMKRDPVAFRDFDADINLIKAKASAEQIKIYALFLRDTAFELEASEIFQVGDKAREKLVAAAKGLASLGERLIVDFGGNPLAMLGEMQIQSFDLDADTNASFTEDVGKLKDAFNKAIADMEKGAEAQQALAALGFGNGSIDIDKVEERFKELSGDERAKFGADIAEMLGHVETGLERTADVQSEILAIIVEEVVTAGIGKSVRALKTLNDGLKTKKALGKLDNALTKINDAKIKQSNSAGTRKLAEKQAELGKLSDEAAAAGADLKAAQDAIQADVDAGGAFNFDRLNKVPDVPPKPDGTPVDIGTIKGPDGQDIRITGQEVGQGKTATAFVTDDVPPKVFRLIPDTNDPAKILEAARDNQSLEGLLSANLNSKAVRVIPSRPLKGAKGRVQAIDADGNKVFDLNGKPVIVDAQVQEAVFAKSGRKQLAEQGGKLTKGQTAAIKNMREELLAKGIINTDGKLDNLSFINEGGDNWVVGILDPGGFEKFTGPNAVADARKFQDAYDEFTSTFVNEGGSARDQIVNALFARTNLFIEKGVDLDRMLLDNLPGVDSSQLKFTIPSQRQKNFPNTIKGDDVIDISDQVAKHKKLKDAAEAAKGRVDDVSGRVDAAVRDLDEILPQAQAEAATAAAKVNEGVASKASALKELAALESQRPGALSAAVGAITDDARRGLIVLSRVAAEGNKEADCVRMRAVLAEGDASEEVRALAREKCDLAVAEAAQ